MLESSNDHQKRLQRRRGRKSNDRVNASLESSGRSVVNGKATTIGTAPNHHASASISGASHSSLLISSLADGELWHTCGPVSAERNALLQLQPSSKMSGNGPQQQSVPNPADVILKYRQQADHIYRKEIQLFNSQQSLSSDDQWVETTIRKGTLKDRIAAMSVVISTDPIHKLHTLDSLLSMAGCQATTPMTSSSRKPTSNASTTPNSRVVQMAAEALEDLFIHTLLPSDRKLYTLSQRPLMLYESTNPSDSLPQAQSSSRKTKKKKGNAQNNAATKRTLSPRILLLWRFEEMVKERYDWFLRQYISRTLNDSLSHTVTSPTKTSTTAMDGPKIAALRTASALIRSIPEGETFLLPLLVNKLGDPKATVCAGTSYELRKILHVHPAMTDIVAREVQQLVHRPHLSVHAMYNCITFLNQLKLSRPKSIKDGKDQPSSNLAVSLMNTYFRLFDVAMLQQKQQSSPSGSPSDSSTNYQTRLLSALLTGVNRAHPYVPSSNDADGNGSLSLLTEHVDSLYRIVHTAPPAARTQSLLLLFHVAVGSEIGDPDRKEKKKAEPSSNLNSTSQRDRFYRALYATLSDPTMIGTGKHLTMYFNLLFKSMKYETDMSRLQAFAKRLWSTALQCSSAVLAAAVFLIDAIAYEHHPTLFKSYRDVLSEPDSLRILDPTKREPRGALIVLGNEGKDGQEAVVETSGAETCVPGWEYALTMHHYHPSVQKFTSIFGHGENISDKYTGDPLQDFALAPFLDKFAYRNPKSTDRKTDQGDDISGKRLGVGSRRNILERNQTPLNDPSFIEQSTVHPHEEFFHKFFVERASRDGVKGIARKKVQEEQDIDAAESEAFDRIESRNADQNMLDNYDDWDQWETDDEEEAFVDSLAQKIIDDAMDGNTVDDLDAEDPDTEGWDDKSAEDSEVEDDQNIVSGSVEEGFEDDGQLEDDDSVEDDRPSDDSFVGDSDDDDVAALVEDEDSEDGDIVAMVDEEESDDDEAPMLVPLRPDVRHTKDSVFADADEYSEVIEKSWISQKRQHHTSADEDSEEKDGKNLATSQVQSGKRRKRNRQKIA